MSSELGSRGLKLHQELSITGSWLSTKVCNWFINIYLPTISSVTELLASCVVNGCNYQMLGFVSVETSRLYDDDSDDELK